MAARAVAHASGLGVPADIVRVSVDAAPGESVEAAARTARYAALASAAAEDSRDIWVAHTLDDQAETLLLGALRGNPAGMAPISALDAGPRLVRPFLSVRRADTVGACDELSLAPWYDPMNDDHAYRRVAVRTSVIPGLSDLIGGDAVPALARTAERIAADQALLASLTDLSPTSDCAVLAAAPAPVRQRRILAWLREHGQQTIGGAQLADIERLCTDWHGQGPVAVGGGRSVARIDGRLTLT